MAVRRLLLHPKRSHTAGCWLLACAVLVASLARPAAEPDPLAQALRGREHLADYARMVSRYRAGHAEVVAELLAWPKTQVRELLPFIEQARANLGWTSLDFETAALLHTDAAWRALEAADSDAMSFHLTGASRILMAGGPDVADFAGRWYAAVAQRLRAENGAVLAESLLSDGRKQLPEDRRVLYESGVTAEVMAAADSEARPRHLADAERWLGAARGAGHEGDLARLHLGRVLLLQQKDDEALALLDVLHDDETTPQVAYLAALLGGAIHERNGRLDQAARHYLDAIRTYTAGAAAYVALSEVLQRQGRHTDAELIMHKLVDNPANAESTYEPAWTYAAEPLGLTRQMTDDLRTEVRTSASPAATDRPAAAEASARREAAAADRVLRARTRLPTYTAIVEAYRSGRNDVALDQLFQWGSDDLRELVEQVVETSSSRQWRDRQTEAAVMLHTDAAQRLMAMQSPEGVLFHLDAASRILASGGESLRPFSRRWYEAAARWLRFEHLPDTARTLLTAGRLRLPDDPVVLYESGVVAEALGASDADALLRQALAAGSPGAVTRLHLGRVLGVQKKDDEALLQLDSAQQQAADARVAYEALLLAGSIEERRGNVDAAVHRYRGAIDRYPPGQSAYIALSEALRRSGAPEEAEQVLKSRLFRTDGAPAQEPGWWYGSDPLPEVQVLLDNLRHEVQR